MSNNKQLVDYLIDKKVLRTKTIINAFYKIDRKFFVPKDLEDKYYLDNALPIWENSTISQPTTVWFMLELLWPSKWDQILDIWCWSCWTTVLLAEIVWKVWKVFWVEINPNVLEFGQRNVNKFNYDNIKIFKSWKTLWLPEFSPYDKILVSASSSELPKLLLDQLIVWWTIVIPIDNSLWKVIKTNENSYEKAEYQWFIFVPLQ